MRSSKRIGVLGVAMALVAAMTPGCGSGSSCSSGWNYCMDPGGNGIDQCCPAGAWVYCVNKKGCIPMDSITFSDGSCGLKYACSSEY